MPSHPGDQRDQDDQTRRATIRDVAARAGVSVATVSRVLAGNYPAAPSTRARVQQAVRDLDYVVNAHARALSGRSAKMIAILLSNVTIPFYASVAQGVEEQAALEGRLCLICTTGGDAERELEIIKLLREQGAEAVILVGGVVVTPEYRVRMAKYARALDSAGAQLILCGRPGLGDDVPARVVDYDSEGGAYAATSHLLSAGHQRVAFLGGQVGMTTSDSRVAGWERALRERGLASGADLRLLGGFGQGFAYDAVRQQIKAGDGHPPFTAIFAYDDHLAAGALQAVRDGGLRVPDDISVIGYDDVPMAAHTDPPLTTVHIPAEELGRTAVRLALHSDDQLFARRLVTLGTHVVVRGSVAPPG